MSAQMSAANTPVDAELSRVTADLEKVASDLQILVQQMRDALQSDIKTGTSERGKR